MSQSTETISKWDLHFLRLAREASQMSKDPRTKIGALIVKDRRILSTGYNGFPKGVADDERLRDSRKYELIVHAEMNAVLFAGREAQGGTLYLHGFTGAPCRNCTKHLIQAGIERIVVSGAPVPDHWCEDLAAAAETLKEAGIELHIYTGIR